MATIFKWFFGIVGTIILVYVLVLLVRTVLSATAGSVSTATTATSTNAIKNFFSNLYKPSPYVPGSVVVAGTTANNNTGGYRNPIADKILNAYSRWNFNGGSTDDFDARWGGKESVTGNNANNSNSKNAATTENNSRIILTSVRDGGTIVNNQVITGYADESVYSDKTFPIYILDQDKKIIGQIKAFTNGDRRGNGYIPFRGVLLFSAPNQAFGYLMLKDENNMYKIYFRKAGRTSILNALPTIIQPSTYFRSYTNNNKDRCVIAGCSMQFCVEESQASKLVSSCEYLNAYACYRNALCERNANTGKCSWRIDSELAQCLENSN